MPNYWIFVTNGPNWEVVRKKLIWGLPKGRENAIRRVRKGDLAFIYVMSEKRGDEVVPPRIAGLFEVASEPFTSSEPVFKGGAYPNRVRLRPVLVPDRPVEFKPLIPKLSFIRNKRFWTGHLRSEMAKISKEGYDLLRRELGCYRGS